MRIQSGTASYAWKLVLVSCAAYGLLGAYGLNFPCTFTYFLAAYLTVAFIAVCLLQRAKQTDLHACGCD